MNWYVAAERKMTRKFNIIKSFVKQTMYVHLVPESEDACITNTNVVWYKDVKCSM